MVEKSDVRHPYTRKEGEILLCVCALRMCHNGQNCVTPVTGNVSGGLFIDRYIIDGDVLSALD